MLSGQHDFSTFRKIGLVIYLHSVCIEPAPRVNGGNTVFSDWKFCILTFRYPVDSQCARYGPPGTAALARQRCEYVIHAG